MMAYEDHPMVDPGPALAVPLEDDEFSDPAAGPQPEIEDHPHFE
jgi:hypothetical protein